jgi:hypothetical protein
MNVFQFQTNSSNGYKAYFIKRPEEKDEHIESILHSFQFDHISIKDRWQPLKFQLIDDISYPPGILEGDISYCNSLSGKLFSQRAVDVLQPYLQDAVEFLPMKYQNKFLFATNVLKFFNMNDALDMNKSIITWDMQTQREKDLGLPKKRSIVGHFVPYFRDEHLLNEILIFIIKPCMLDEIYVTDKFVDIVNKNKLTGAVFVKVYPPPDPEEARRTTYEKAMKKRKGKNYREQNKTDTDETYNFGDCHRFGITFKLSQNREWYYGSKLRGSICYWILDNKIGNLHERFDISIEAWGQLKQVLENSGKRDVDALLFSADGKQIFQTIQKDIENEANDIVEKNQFGFASTYDYWDIFRVSLELNIMYENTIFLFEYENQARLLVGKITNQETEYYEFQYEIFLERGEFDAVLQKAFDWLQKRYEEEVKIEKNKNIVVESK